MKTITSSARRALISITVVAALAIVGCATVQRSAKKVSTDLATLNAWASSPQGTAEIRATEKAAGNILATVAPLIGASKAADYLDAAATISNAYAYAGESVPVNVVNDTLAAVPSIIPVVSPLVSNGPNTLKTATVITALAATVRNLPSAAPSPSPEPVGQLLPYSEIPAVIYQRPATWDSGAYPNPNADPVNPQRNRQLALMLH